MARNGPSRVGLRNAGRGPLFAPSTIANRSPASHMSSVLKTKPQGTFSPHISSGKFDVLDGLLEDKDAWKAKNDNERSAQEPRRKSRDGSSHLATSTALNIASKADSSIPEWRRKCPRSEKHLKAAGSVAPNRLLKTPDPFGCASGSTASKVPCDIMRSWDQPRMADAGPMDYYPFHKHDFTLGTIIRAVVHEQCFTESLKPAPPFAPSTAVTNAGKEHVTHGDFGSVYSENRFLIIVNNRPKDHYLAVPVYSHRGNGLAKKLHRDEYVSVADHRFLEHCQQQSAHAPLVTESLKDGVDELLPVSVAYASYPVSRKYLLPVAHQGRLDDESTRRLVKMYVKWGMPYGTDEQ